MSVGWAFCHFFAINWLESGFFIFGDGGEFWDKKAAAELESGWRFDE